MFNDVDRVDYLAYFCPDCPRILTPGGECPDGPHILEPVHDEPVAA
jgi:hypothetical protein